MASLTCAHRRNPFSLSWFALTIQRQVRTLSQESRPILLVEDDPDEVFGMMTALREAKVKNPVEVVEDVRTAIARLSGDAAGDARARPLPAFVLLDLDLRGRSGLELLAWLKEQPGPGSLPVVALAAAEHPGDVARASKLGARACIAKPRDPGELIAAVRTQVYSWLSGT